MFFGIAFIIVGIYEFRKSKLCLKLAEERGGGVSVPRVEERASDFAKKKHITSKRGDGMRFSVIDIETVNDSPTSIATIGCVGVDNGTIVKTKEYYIKPDPFVFEENATILDVIENGNALNFSDFKARNRVGIRNNKKENYNPNWTLYAKDVEAADVSFHSDNVFHEKNVVISGDLSVMDRKRAYSLLKACGAVPCDNITKKTNYLITNAEVETGKIKKAKEYIARGIEIKIINEEEFVKILKSSYETA